MTKQTAFRWVAIIATIFMFLVMIAGSLVTKTGSGLGCGNDWPLCNGRWVPEYTMESLIEYMHRFVTGMAGVIVLVFAGWAWFRYRGNKEVAALSLFAIFFIVLESWLGASAVIWPQSSPVKALHFGFSLLAFAGVLLLTVFVLERDRSRILVTAPVSSGFRNYIWAVGIYTYGVVYLGAYVRHTESYLACPDWPLCRGELIPELTTAVSIQLAHRGGAALLLLAILGLMIHAIRHYKETRRDIYTASILAFLLIMAQVLSGGVVVFTRLNIFATMFHSAVITCLFGVIAYLCVQSVKRP